eukprot:c9455_g1_i1.p1 GENE.c9455_g1_i1~~c9455_g1_i1.p1  ORF type:complete len:319 (-),score=106.07 c9455_g1_i1:127-1041(-)
MEFPNLGKHCDHPECHLLDFLPFNCDACKATFCLDHHKYADHQCKIGRAPKSAECKTCPHCSQVVSIQPSLTADQSLTNHINQGCPQERKRGPQCVECRKSQLVSMKCSTCNECVCPKHRHPLDHHCGCKRVLTLSSAPKLTTPLTAAINISPSPSPSPSLAPASSSLSSSSSPYPSPCSSIPAPSSPTLSARASVDTISLNVVVSACVVDSPCGQSSTPCRVFAKKSWSVETAVRALCKNFNVGSPEGLCLLMSGSSTAIAHDLPLALIADEIQAVTLVLDRLQHTTGNNTNTNNHSSAVAVN